MGLWLQATDGFNGLVYLFREGEKMAIFHRLPEDDIDFAQQFFTLIGS